MRIGRGRERNSPLDCGGNDSIVGIKLAYGFAPPGCRQFNRKTALRDKRERSFRYLDDGAPRTMAMDLHQVEMRKTIDNSSRRHVADAPKIIGVNVIDIAPGKLLRAFRHRVEHLVRPIEVMH